MIKLTKKILISLIFILLSTGIGFSEDASTEYLVQTSLRNGTTQNTEQLKFNYSVRYTDSDGRLQYIYPTGVHLNKQLLAPTGKNYYLRLSEGKNTISIQYLKNGALSFDTYNYYLDTTPPYINVSGIYNYMTSNTSHIKFSAKAGDALSVPEAIRLRVMLNDKELNLVNGEYRGILNQSLANYSSQKEATNDNHPTDNIVSIEATDGQGNQTTKTYHITYTPNEIDYNQMRYLIEKVPGLISQNDLYDNVGRYSPVGVALDDSNITVLGTFGGYVVLGHDVPIYNHEGDDFVVNAHWSDQDIPLTSVMVMEDTNGNMIPDDIWYRIKDSFGEDKEGSNYTINYSFDEKGEYTTYQGGASQLQLQTPVTTPLPSSYLEMAKELNWKQFRPTHYVLDGNIKYMHDKDIETVHFANKGYNIDNAYDKDGNAVSLNKIDFVKVYTNTLDPMVNVGSVMPGVNYVSVIEQQHKHLIYNKKQLSKLSDKQANSGDVIDFASSNGTFDITKVNIIQSKPLVNEDHILVYPAKNQYNQIPYKLENNTIQFFSPYNKTQVSVDTFSNSTTEQLDTLINLYTNTNQINALEWSELIATSYLVDAYLNHSALLTIQENGVLELLKLSLDNLIHTKLDSVFAELNNSNDKILKLKWMTDFLSDDMFNKINIDYIRKLDDKLLKLCESSPISTMLVLNEKTIINIKPVRNIGFNLSIEEYERKITPTIIIKQDNNIDLTTHKELAFNISFYKNGVPIKKLYRDIEYKIDLPSNNVYILYHIMNEVRVEIPLIFDDSDTTFSSNKLGDFLLIQQ